MKVQSLLVGSLLAATVFWAPAVFGETKPCTLDWAKEGAVTGPSYLWGLGISTNTDPTAAHEEARNKAYSDVALQLKSSVQANSNLSETDKSTAFNSMTVVESKMSSINAVKIFKEGSDPSQKFTACVVARLDAREAYKIPEGQMKSLEAKTTQVGDALAAKKYLQVLQLASAAKTDIEAAKDSIYLADTYKIFLMEMGPTWNERFSTLAAKIGQAEQTAKDTVVFVFPAGTYEEAFVDVESQLSGQGYTVVSKATDVEKGKLPVSIELKQVGGLRKTKSALGRTAIAKIMITMRDGQSKQLLASNKGADVIGTGPDDETAVANVARQLSTHVLKVVKDGLPGIIKEDAP